MAFCGNCGFQLPEGSKFCPRCGAAVAASSWSGAKTTDNSVQEALPAYESAGAAYTGYRAPIAKRDIAVCIILSIITCGIYGIIWFCYLHQDLNTATQTQQDNSAGMVILLSIVTCGIYSLVWIYHAGQKVDLLKQWNNEPSESSPVMFLVLSLFGFSIIAYCLIQSQLNKVAMYEK